MPTSAPDLSGSVDELVEPRAGAPDQALEAGAFVRKRLERPRVAVQAGERRVVDVLRRIGQAELAGLRRQQAPSEGPRIHQELGRAFLLSIDVLLVEREA